MKKRKILMLTLPLVGVATIVGSGFSAWYFDNTEIGTSKNVGITTAFGLLMRYNELKLF